MARGKKKEKELTPEEKLQRALVPVDEQPYELPGNWCWVNHNSILDISGGSQPSKSYFISDHKEGYTQLYQTRDYGEHPIPVFIPDRFATKTTNEGDILLARYGGSLGKVFRAHAGAYNVALAKVIILYPAILNKEFLYKYYFSQFYQEFCIKASSGRSAQAGFNRNDMEGLLFPLPPLPEQQRIVDRIDSMFAKLDEAKEKAQAVVDGFEDRKAAILHRAFSGELTEEWRKQHSLSKNEWIKANFADLGETKLGKMLDKEKNTGRPVPYLRNVNVRWFEFDLSDVSTMLATDEEIEKLKIKVGDLFICEGGEPGRCAIWKDESECLIFQKALHRFRPYDKVLSGYLCYYLYYLSLSDSLEQYFTGTTIKHLTGKSLAKIKVLLPSLLEQGEIVSLIDEIFQSEQQAKEAAEQVVSQIDTMKKAILARAFRGELGTNDPTDESAEKLLERMLI